MDDKLLALKKRVELARAGIIQKMDSAPPPAKPASIHSSVIAGGVASIHAAVPVGLRAIMQNESSGGKNLNHPKVETGQNAGHTAGGGYAVMPITFKDVVTKNPDLSAKYGHIAAKQPDEITHHLNTDQGMARDVAQRHYNHLTSVFNGDHIKVAHAWLHGATGTKNTPEEKIVGHPYVQKYLKNYAKEEARGPQHAAKVPPPNVSPNGSPTPPAAVATPSGGISFSKTIGERLARLKSVAADLKKMAIADIKPGKRDRKAESEYHDPNPPKIHDYSHVLTPEHRKAGYTLKVKHDAPLKEHRDGTHYVHATVYHKNHHVGTLQAEHDPYDHGDQTLRVEDSHIKDKAHRGKGLGTAMYEAAYAHAKHKMGLKRVAGGIHSTSASAVHQKLAAKHGLAYKPEPNELGALDPRLGAAKKKGDYDGHHAGYKYALKSDVEPNDLEKATGPRSNQEASDFNSEARRGPVRSRDARPGMGIINSHAQDRAIEERMDPRAAGVRRQRRWEATTEKTRQFNVKRVQARAAAKRAKEIGPVSAEVEKDIKKSWSEEERKAAWDKDASSALVLADHLQENSHKVAAEIGHPRTPKHTDPLSAKHHEVMPNHRLTLWHNQKNNRFTTSLRTPHGFNHYADEHGPQKPQDHQWYASPHEAVKAMGEHLVHKLNPKPKAEEIAKATGSPRNQAAADRHFGWTRQDRANGTSDLAPGEPVVADKRLRTNQDWRVVQEKLDTKTNAYNARKKADYKQRQRAKEIGPVSAEVEKDIVKAKIDEHNLKATREDEAKNNFKPFRTDAAHKAMLRGERQFRIKTGNKVAGLPEYPPRRLGEDDVRPHDPLTSRASSRATDGSRVAKMPKRKAPLPAGHDRSNPKAVGTNASDFNDNVKKSTLEKMRLLKMAIKDIKPGEKDRSTQTYDIHDYSHVLTPEHRKAGYDLKVWHNRYPGRAPVGDSGGADVKAVVSHNGTFAGHVTGMKNEREDFNSHSLTPHSDIAPAHRGKGLGVAAYEALYAHAKHKMGIHHISGGSHTIDAQRVHEKLAQKHGLGYSSKPLKIRNKTTGEVRRSKKYRSAYKYVLKSEE